MTVIVRRGVLTALAVVGFAACASAAERPVTHYDLKDINFDMWCQEQQNLPPDRCDKRLPEDEEAFKAYVDKMHGYELRYLQKRQREQEINRDILHNDPVDNPNDPTQSLPEAVPGTVAPK